MRPKKRILLIDPNEVRASVRTYMLTIHGYRVIRALGAAEARQLFDALLPDLVLADRSTPDLGQLLDRLHERNSSVPHLVLAEALRECNVTCDAFLAGAGNADLIERVRVMVARKRGPKKGIQRAAIQDEAARRIA